jgi:hypothetical protein
MAIQDSNAERRNLMVTSIGFIAYFYAGGSFPNSSVRLQVINADFSRPEVLSVMAWTAFIWFLYRYWVTHSGDFTKHFRGELYDLRIKSYIKSYALKRLDRDLVIGQKDGHIVSQFAWGGGCLKIGLTYITNVVRDENGDATNWTIDADTKEVSIKMSDLNGWALALKINLECMLKYPSFSNYMVPYILALVAIAGIPLRNLL